MSAHDTTEPALITVGVSNAQLSRLNMLLAQLREERPSATDNDLADAVFAAGIDALEQATDALLMSGTRRLRPSAAAVLTHRTLSPEWLAAVQEAAAAGRAFAELPGGGIAFINDGKELDTSHLDCPACGGSGHIGGTRTAAARDVLAERRRQIEAEGWMPDHDDEHSAGQMAEAAACYAMGAAVDGPERSVMDSFGTNGTPHRVTSLWPWDREWHKPTSRRRDLVKAAALILAEIERIDRASTQEANQ